MRRFAARNASPRLSFFAVLLTLSLIFSSNALGQANAATAQASPQQIASKIDEYMVAATRVNRFTGSVLVARGGQPLLSKGYGMADMEARTPNTPQTKFRLGSVTKQFTATAIMILQERGKLNVGDSVCKYLADCPAAWQPITIRHLLTHTSGIPNYTSFPDFIRTTDKPVTATAFVETFKNKPLEFAPGERFKYSNSGYHLLGLIIERASGRPYADFLRESIFTPLGMTDTGYDHNEAKLTNRAVGYALQDESLVKARYIHMSIPYAAGALYSTAEDMLRWDQGLYTTKLLSQKSIDEMFTPFKSNYGYGWVITKQFDHRVVAHGGSIFGFESFIARFPDDRVTVIVLSNNEDAPSERIAADLSAIVFGESYKIPQERKAVALNPQTLDRYAGQSQLAPNFIITITSEAGKLMLQATAQPKLELFAESETEFFLKAVDAQVSFVKDAQGKITQLILHQNGRDLPAPKIK